MSEEPAIDTSETLCLEWSCACGCRALHDLEHTHYDDAGGSVFYSTTSAAFDARCRITLGIGGVEYVLEPRILLPASPSERFIYLELDPTRQLRIGPVDAVARHTYTIGGLSLHEVDDHSLIDERTPRRDLLRMSQETSVPR